MLSHCVWEESGSVQLAFLLTLGRKGSDLGPPVSGGLLTQAGGFLLTFPEQEMQDPSTRLLCASTHIPQRWLSCGGSPGHF